MTTSNLPVPRFHAATYPAFLCCLCTQTDLHSMVMTVPKYAEAQSCPDCQHTVCVKHMVKCGLCQGCCWEKHGSHFEEQT